MFFAARHSSSDRLGSRRELSIWAGCEHFAGFSLHTGKRDRTTGGPNTNAHMQPASSITQPQTTRLPHRLPAPVLSVFLQLLARP
jgi:hypothetical protein